MLRSDPDFASKQSGRLTTFVPAVGSPLLFGGSCHHASTTTQSPSQQKPALKVNCMLLVICSTKTKSSHSMASSPSSRATHSTKHASSWYQMISPLTIKSPETCKMLRWHRDPWCQYTMGQTMVMETLRVHQRLQALSQDP